MLRKAKKPKRTGKSGRAINFALDPTREERFNARVEKLGVSRAALARMYVNAGLDRDMAA